LERLAALAVDGLARPLPIAPEAVLAWAGAAPEAREEAARKDWRKEERRSWRRWRWEEQEHFERIWGAVDDPLDIPGFRDHLETLGGLLAQMRAPGAGNASHG
jgi:exonuclease V gamma subunit